MADFKTALTLKENFCSMKTVMDTEDVKELVETYRSLPDEQQRLALRDIKLRRAMLLAKKLDRRKTRPMRDADIIKVVKEIRKKKVRE